MTSDDILATGFVADTPDVSSDYPSAGADSSMPQFQAIYWRCVTAFLYSAAVNGAGCRRMVFSNIEPPVVDGIDLAGVFRRLGAEHVRLPLKHRLPQAQRWGNVFYFLDILHSLPKRGRLALFDSDVVLTGSAASLMNRIGETGLAGYVVATPPDEDVNGLTMQQAARIAEGLSSRTLPPSIPHFGGELLGVDLDRRRDVLHAFDQLWQDMGAGVGDSGKIRTEEHLWSIVFAARDWPVANANDQIGRLWTARHYRSVTPADARLPMWHLPAEKRYGFVDLFRWMAARDFAAVEPAEFHAVAARCFGIPRASVHKRVRDTMRGIRYRLG